MKTSLQFLKNVAGHCPEFSTNPEETTILIPSSHHSFAQD
jgi:hypothetical protein